MKIIKFSADDVGNIVVLPIFISSKSKSIEILAPASVSKKIDLKKLQQTLKKIGSTANPDEVLKVTQGDLLIIATGLGAERKFSAEDLRRAAGSAARNLEGEKSATFAFAAKTEEELTAVAEGAALGSYVFSEFKGSSKLEMKPALAEVTIINSLGSGIQTKRIGEKVQILAKNSNLVRDLINTPPSHLTPIEFVNRVKKIALSLKLKVEVLDEKTLKTKGYGGITAVGQGSANPPRLIRISYTPAKAKKSYALVGKGITFDTGGLALKPANGMEEMKADMSGAAAVIAAIFSAAELKLPIAIDAWAPLAENMVSDTATRPSDIIKIYGGKTVEVLNPDAEGRLILADALVRAQEFNKKLDGVIDVATLTGAQVVALGTRFSAVMSNDEKFSKKFLDATKKSGEQFWPMPLPQELRASLDSPVADIANIGERMGGMLVAGLFLKEFVNIPWLHLDIAGPAFNSSKAHGYTPVGGTGVALRSLISLFEGDC